MMFRSRKEQEPGPENVPAAPKRVPARPGAFLGTLRSEFDEPETLPEGFQTLANNVETLMEAYQAGRLTKRELAERLSTQRATDHDGGEWTLGATTLSWYRRQGALNTWMQVPPPSQAIGNPRPGIWENPLDIPEKVEEEAKEEAAETASVNLTKVDTSLVTPVAPEPKMAFPSDYIPGGAPHTTEPATYDETFEAGLAALLADTSEAAYPVEEVEAGPAPRINTFDKTTLEAEEPSYLEDDEELSEGIYDGYLQNDAVDADTLSYFDELLADAPAEATEIVIPEKVEEVVVEEPEDDIFPPGFYWEEDPK